jgi:hypothetical protein
VAKPCGLQGEGTGSLDHAGFKVKADKDDRVVIQQPTVQHAQARLPLPPWLIEDAKA